MRYRASQIEITRHRHAGAPYTELVYGFFDEDRLVTYSEQKFDLSAAAAILNGRVKENELRQANSQLTPA